MNDIYTEAEIRLATLLGWTELQVGGQCDGNNVPDTWVTGVPPDGGFVRDLVPMWTKSGDQCLILQAEYRLRVDVMNDRVEVNDEVEYFRAHGFDIPLAIKYAVIMAVICILEAPKLVEAQTSLEVSITETL